MRKPLQHTEEAFETALEAAQNGQNELFANTLNILTLFALQKDKQMPDISMSACASGVSEQARTNLLILSLAKRNKFESIFPLIQQRTLHDKYFARNMVSALGEARYLATVRIWTALIYFSSDRHRQFTGLWTRFGSNNQRVSTNQTSIRVRGLCDRRAIGAYCIQVQFDAIVNQRSCQNGCGIS